MISNCLIMKRNFTTNVLLLLVFFSATAQTTVFEDNFNAGTTGSAYTSGGSPTAVTYTTTNTYTAAVGAAPAGTTKAASATPAGGGDKVLQVNAIESGSIIDADGNSGTTLPFQCYTSAPLSAYLNTHFSPTLSSNTGNITWTFNLRTLRGTVNNLNANYYAGVALTATSSSFNSTGDGYGIILTKGTATTNNSVRLVKYTGGFKNAASSTLLIQGVELSVNTNGASVKVVYTPSTNTWLLSTRDDGAADNIDPTTGTTDNGTVVDGTYTGSAATHFGFIYGFQENSTGGNFKTLINNFKVAAASALPVSLVSFKARPTDNQVQLEWLTASEQNNHFFSVERSGDGRNFSSIGTVKGKGTTQEASTYIYTDIAPLAGVSYYRLQQVDFDGKETFSKTIAVGGGKNAKVKVFPNLFSNTITLELSDADAQLKSVHVYDLSGRVVFQKAFDTEGGVSPTLDLTQLNAGAYFIHIKTQKGATVEKIQKL
jgi:hypothetical protein